MIKEIFITQGQTESDDYTSAEEESSIVEEEFELPIDIARRGGHLIVKTPIVGAMPSDISLTINNDVMTIHKQDPGDTDKFDNYYLKECHWGAVAREFRLPLKIDPSKAEAKLQDGILRITLPIIDQSRGKSIKIN